MTQIKRLTIPDNPDTRVYFSHTVLPEHITARRRGQGAEADNSFLDAALGIPGVMFAQVGPYELLLIKAPSFEWAEVEEGVLRLLAAFNTPEGALGK